MERLAGNSESKPRGRRGDAGLAGFVSDSAWILRRGDLEVYPADSPACLPRQDLAVQPVGHVIEPPSAGPALLVLREQPGRRAG